MCVCACDTVYFPNQTLANFTRHNMYTTLHCNGCYSLTNHICLKELATQHVKHVTEEHSFVLFSASSCICKSSTLCFLFSCVVAPVGTETGMYTQVNQDHLQLLNVCLCDTFFTGLCLFCNVVFYADREKRTATGRQTAFMDLVK